MSEYWKDEYDEVILNNWRDAYAILAGIPGKRFVKDLEFYFSNFDYFAGVVKCNTLACGAGWLNLHPRFADTYSISLKMWPPRWLKRMRKNAESL